MKIFFTLTLMFFYVMSFAQTTLKTNDNGVVEYSQVIQVEASTQKDLYKKAKKWFVNTFKDAKEVIQTEDEDGIIGKGSFHLDKTFTTPEGWVKFTLEVQFKEGRYKYTFNDFYFDAIPSDFSGQLGPERPTKLIMKKAWQKVLNESATQIEAVEKSLISAMSAEIEKQDDW